MKKLLYALSLVTLAAGCQLKTAETENVDANGFGPMSFRMSATNAFEVSVWGRTYRYRDSVFPVSVKTAGREIFAAPMALHASFGGKEGVFHSWLYTLVEETPDRIVVVAAAHCENVMVNAAMTFERDGLARTELKIVPYGYYSLHHVRDYDPTLDKLWFDIDLTAESSTLFHYWPYSENSCVVTADVNSGATKTCAHPFRAYTWCGWEDGGFSVTCESAAGFELKDMRKCIEVTTSKTTNPETSTLNSIKPAVARDARPYRFTQPPTSNVKRQTSSSRLSTLNSQPSFTRVRYNLLDDVPVAWKGRRDRWGDALMPLCYEFGLQATPVKARPLGDPDVYRRLHIYELDKARVLEDGVAERFGRAGVRYVVLHSTYSRAEGYGLIGDKEKFRAIVDAFHRNGVKVLVYYGYEYPTIMPGWSKKKDDYLIRHPGGKWVGGWQAETHRAYQSCYMSGWADEVKRNAIELVDEYGLDGIYTDGMYIPWECANERHGCGWRDAKDELHPTFPIYAIRDLARDLQAAMHVRGGTIDAHQSACMITPLLAFADSCFDGENVQGALAKNPEHLPTDSFRCEYSGYAFGLPMTFIAYTNRRLTIEMLASITLVHNVHPVPRELTDLDFVSKVWKIYEKREMDSAEFVPYWRKNISDTKGVWCSQYRGKKSLTAVVSNLTNRDRTATLDFGCGDGKARDLLTDRTYDVKGGRLTITTKPFAPMILAVD